MASSAEELIQAVGLVPIGSVRWGTSPTLDSAGVYVVEADQPYEPAPISETRVAAWLARVPTLRLDGQRPTAAEVVSRLSDFWIRGETVVYIGLAGTSVTARVRAYCRTPLGDRKPHAGGHWIQTLQPLDRFRVWWAATSDPAGAEQQLLTAFARGHGSLITMPFANRTGAGGVRKPHGITGATISDDPRPAHPIASRQQGVPAVRARAGLAAINAALQRYACRQPERAVTAVDAARELERLGLLRDSPTRPGKPLRDLLRQGLIDGGSQEDGRLWTIKCLS